VNFFHYLSEFYGFPIEYHFFESYHGSSLCDAHAGHVKSAIRNIIRDGTQVKDFDTFFEIIVGKGLKNAVFEKMVPLKDTMITVLKAIPGIKKLYKFLYDGLKIEAFATSTDTTARSGIHVQIADT
jgi:hypothetical protein